MFRIYEESKMNLEQERPFVCSAPGCSQRFPTEDHLMIHRHKHEMTLKFPSIKTDNMLSDQTPTPTRFLKNCEEVGLFSELDCSLEHEFRKAQEEESSKRNISMHNPVGGAMAGPGAHQLGSARMPNHDTSVVIQQAMPSPQSSSVITQAPSTNRQIGPVPGSLSSLLHLHNRQRQPMPASMPGTLPNPTMPGSSAVLMPMERQMSVNSNLLGMQGPNLSNPCASPQVQPMHSEAKMRLKAALTHHPAAMSNGNMNTMGHMMEMMGSRQDQTPHHHMHSHPHQHQTLPAHHPYPHQHQHPAHHPHPQPHHQQNHPHHHSHSHLHAHPAHHQTSPHPPLHSGNQAQQVSPATQQMQPTQTIQPPQPTGGRRRRVVDEDPDERRRKFLERNRAAATRCRQKRKVWVMSLEKKAEELTQTNMQLQNEVSMLKNEVAQLKQLLLTHKDCPITAMQKESQGYLSPESSPPASPTPACSQQQVIQHNTITTSSAVSEVVGSSTLSQLTTHRTDLNPIL
ncbi:cyclic AMP-responsive element-binding protein 5 isoform X6 [Bubalus kerabau]|uniref:cyclic AMP-responsive element-binding protein 5 isoform X6 n=1 Tax=Bubalus carabanensis TaxID=3119969 RepID=UPI00244EF458|nr:cyclic AMP-responsive element-binding protein 5 isoform X6 [Bubalus carabanensis]